MLKQSSNADETTAVYDNLNLTTGENYNITLMTYDEDAEVKTIMNSNVTTFDAGTSLEKAYEKMRYQQISMAPVIENERVKGVIDMDNINEFIMVRSAKRRRA